MEISTQQFKHCDLLVVNGRIDSYTSHDLASALEAVIEARRYNIILDISQVDYMSSAGMRVLMSAQKTCKRYNRGEVVLVGVSERIRQALELAGFTPLFRFFDEPTLAVGYF